MTQVQETSREAWREIQENLPERQRQVLETLRRIQPAANYDVAQASGFPPNVVTPRMLELRTAGLVIESHRERHPDTGRKAIYWKVAD